MGHTMTRTDDRIGNLRSRSAAIAVPIPPGLRLRPASRRERKLALAVLLTGRTQQAEQAVQGFLRYVRDNQVDMEHLWLAWDGDVPVAASLVIPAAGRTGMAFLSPLHQRHQLPAAAAVIDQAVRQLDPAQVRLVQVLLEPGQDLDTEALLGADFKALAHLLYMQRLIGPADVPRPLELDPSLRYIAWSERDRQTFAQAILTSYEKTLDCPGLLGMRDIEDIMAGHMATGTFDPALWLAVYQDEQPAAVMLLSHQPQRQALELVYLGVSVAFRGRGLGKALLGHAIHLARQHRHHRIMLAVDEHNAPALKLYRALQFTLTARRTALVRALPMEA